MEELNSSCKTMAGKAKKIFNNNLNYRPKSDFIRFDGLCTKKVLKQNSVPHVNRNHGIIYTPP